ncbi:MAG: T9SS type A sorting domain-containing protein [Candidatus Marinimicrobia bacterium]|nr:T9SS type A sorting domain-containing protein [Candidatus Neomarinimicrobiota bacterium]
MIVIPSALEGGIELKFTQVTASDEAGDPTIFSFGMIGLFEIGTTGISDESRKIIPEYFVLHQNYPNPFNPVTTIPYELLEAGDITLTIQNILGQEVTTLVDSYQQAGVYRVVWDGRDNNGQAVNRGLYLYQIKSKKFMAAKKMILLK